MKNLVIAALVTWLINIYGTFESKLQMAIWDVVFVGIFLMILLCIDLMETKKIRK